MGPIRTLSLAVTCALAGAALLAAPPAAEAQQADTLRARYMIELPPTIQVMTTSGRVSPGSTAGSPFAFGPNWGDGFVGVGFTGRARYAQHDSFRDNVDGSVSTGFGLGNSRDLIGLEVGINFLSTIDSGIGNRMAAGFKVHRVFLGDIGVAVGVESALRRGMPNVEPSYFGVVSKVWDQRWWNPFQNITGSVGLGNNRFLREGDQIAGRSGVNPFGSIGVQIWEPVSVIADWTGQDLSLGASLVPFVGVPLVITPALVDITGAAGDGVRFTVGAGMGFQWANIGRLFP